MKNKQFEMAVTNFKYDQETGVFECYGNVKGNIDHALDRTLDGAYQKSIDKHMANKTMPKMFWNHNPYDVPVGKWLEMREDSKGLFMKGKLFTKSAQAIAIKEAAEEGVLDSFSIGYREIESKWNSEKNCNDLIELDIVETSWVNFACNEESRLVAMKAKMDEGELPTKRELEAHLKASGFSARQAKKIVDNYSEKSEPEDVFKMMATPEDPNAEDAFDLMAKVQ